MPCPDRSSNTGFWELHLQPPPGLPQAPPPGTGDRRAREREAPGRSLKVRHGRVHVEGASSKSGHRSLTAPSIQRREALPPVALLPHPPPEGHSSPRAEKPRRPFSAVTRTAAARPW